MNAREAGDAPANPAPLTGMLTGSRKEHMEQTNEEWLEQAADVVEWEAVPFDPEGLLARIREHDEQLREIAWSQWKLPW